MAWGRLLFWASLSALHLAAQPGTISTVAGAFPLGDGLPAQRASLNFIGALSRDSDGRLIVVESHRLRRVDLEGRITTVLGNGIWNVPRLPWGRGLTIRPGEPFGMVGPMVAGPGGSVYGSTTLNLNCRAEGPIVPSGVIWRFDPPETITPLLGSDGCLSQNLNDGGPAAAAYSPHPNYLTFDSFGRLYFSESTANRVRVITPDGIVRTVAGSGAASADGDGGPAVKAGLHYPLGLAVSSEGDLFIADNLNGRIRRVSPDGTISTAATLASVTFVAAPKSGGLIASASNTVWRQQKEGQPWVRLFRSAGNIVGLFEDRDGSTVVADQFQVFRMSAGGSTVEHLAGVSAGAGSEGPMQFSRALSPIESYVDPDGRLWFADFWGLRKQTERGSMEILVRDGLASFAVGSDSTVYLAKRDRIDKLVDGQRSAYITNDQLKSNDISDIAIHPSGELYIADRLNHRVWKTDSTGALTLVAGSGKAANSGDGGRADAADLHGPQSLAFGKDGSVFVAGASAIWRIDSEGRISTAVGGAGSCSPTASLTARFGACNFSSVAVDPHGELYFTIETTNAVFRIRGVSVARFAGNFNLGVGGDGGPAHLANLWYPKGISFGPNGDLYIADAYGQSVRRVQGFSPFTFNPDQVTLAASLGGPEQTERVSVSPTDREARRFQVQVIYPAGRQGWLQVFPLASEVTPDAPLNLAITGVPRGLPKGIYSARVRLTDPQSEEYTELPVTMLVSGTAQQLRLAQTGYTFVALPGGPAPPPQSLMVQNSGTGSLPFTVATSTLSGNAWLTATPGNGTADANNQPRLSVQVNPAGLAPGVYFGLVTVNSTVADNAPQSAVVLLQVLAAGESPSPIVDPAGLIFTSNTPQSITLGNVRTTASTYTIATPNFPDRRAWFQLPVASMTGNILPGQTAQIQIRPVIDGIPPGQYRAQLSIRFAPDNVTRVVELLLVIANAPTASTKLNAAGACKPTKLLPIFQQPGGGFAATAGWPQLVQLRVVDDCQEPQTKGRVRISFNNGDPALTLTPQAEGVWTGTWSPGRVAARIDLSARAESYEPDLLGVQTVTGGLRDDANRPRIVPGGVFSEASLKKLDPVAVGSNITVQGVRMAAGTVAATTTPLPSRLGETTVLVAGKPLGLSTAAEGEIKGLIPFSVADSTVQQMIVQRGSSYSLPEPVLIAPVQPAVYSVDGTGRGQGEIYVKVEDQLVLTNAARPALNGEDVTIVATGLGAVDPKIPDGAAGAADPVSNVLASLRVQIQGKEAPVKSAALVPGKPGRYQIVVTVPQDVAPDASARVVLTLADQAVSSPVTMSVTRVLE